MQNQPDLLALFSAIWDRLGALSDHVTESLVASNESRAETNDRLANIEQQLLNGHYRMNDIERQQRTGACVGIKSFLVQVASPKEWTVGIIVVLLLLTGVVSPKEIKTYFLGTQEQK